MSNHHLDHGLQVWQRGSEERGHAVYLDLRPDGDCIAVVAVDENGWELPGGCYLAYISPDGRIGRYSAVSKRLGFQLDEKQRIVEEESL